MFATWVKISRAMSFLLNLSERDGKPWKIHSRLPRVGFRPFALCKSIYFLFVQHLRIKRKFLFKCCFGIQDVTAYALKTCQACRTVFEIIPAAYSGMLTKNYSDCSLLDGEDFSITSTMSAKDIIPYLKWNSKLAWNIIFLVCMLTF